MKHPILSKTLWFNLVMAALGAIEVSANIIQPHIAGNVYAYGFLILTVVNAVLRTITNQGVSFSEKLITNTKASITGEDC